MFVCLCVCVCVCVYVCMCVCKLLSQYSIRKKYCTCSLAIEMQQFQNNIWFPVFFWFAMSQMQWLKADAVKVHVLLVIQSSFSWELLGSMLN